MVTSIEGFTNVVPPNTGNNVKATINYIFFDDHFNYVTAGFDAVNSGSTGGVKSHFLQNITIPKNGFIYIYCSNESNIDVFFDNLEVIHTRGPLLEENAFYPFGLRMEGICSKAAGAMQNLFQFNEGSELQRGEFDDGSGMELYDAVNRMYDPQLGRFFQVDEFAESNFEWTPYNFALDNPISFNDPLGLKEKKSESKEGGGGAGSDDPDKPVYTKATDMSPVVVHGVKKLDHNDMQSLYWVLRDHNIDWNYVVKSPVLRERLNRWDRIQRFMDDVHGQQREQEEVVLEIGKEIASWFIPMTWLTKLKYVKYAGRIFKWKRGAAATEKVIAETVETGALDGSFSLTKLGWSKYPVGAPRPSGPFRIISGEEYSAALKLKNKANAALHKEFSTLKGYDFHEWHPVKFGGNPTSIFNKAPLNPSYHREFTSFWRNIQNTTAPYVMQ